MGIAIGLMVGLVLGLTGAGGSIFAVPMLMAGLGWPITQAATIALLAVALSASVGTALAWRHSYVRYRAATLMALIGAALAPVGIRVADGLDPARLALIFAAVLGVVAVRMFRSARASREDAAVVRSAVSGEGRASVGHIGKVNPGTGRLVWTVPVAFTLAAIGALTGFLSGLLGVGGGFVIVPALRASLPLSMHSAVATSLMTISLTSASTFASGVLQGRSVPLTDALPFVAGAVLGMILGRQLAPAISGPRLQELFALAAGAIAVTMAVRTLGGL